MLAPLQEHALLLFWLQLLALFLTARGLGVLARRVGQPPVVGELAAGLLLGPSLFGMMFPQGAAWLFPGDEFHSGLILAVGWVGVILLLVETGFETDLALLRRIGRSTAMVPLGSLVLPLALGIGLGFVMPATLLSADGGRTIFALFMGVCLAVSALPVVAKILIEMGLMRRNVGQVILVGGMVDDIVGWTMLSALAGAASTGRLDPVDLGVTIVAIGVFVALAFTVGRWATDQLLRRALRHAEGNVLPFSAVMLVVLTLAAVTQFIGIEAVFGAFVAGIVIGRSRFFRREFAQTIHVVGHGFLAPIFFATAGMYVDLWALSGTALLWAGIVIIVASVGKLVGSYVGARLGPLGHHEALAVGVGLNARGALEVIIATIAFSIGVFTQQTYSIVVLLALTTSISAPPLLRWVLRHHRPGPEEAARLEQEDFLDASVIANARNALLPVRGGVNSLLAGRVLDLVMQPSAHVTTLSIIEDGHPPDPARALARQCAETFCNVDVEWRVARDADPVRAILDEASLGYDVVAFGLSEELRDARRLSDRLRRLLVTSPAPVLLVRRGTHRDTAPARPEQHIQRVLVPVTGTRIGLAAEEIAYTLGARLHIDVDALHVVDRHDRADGDSSARRQLTRARCLADRMGRGASTLVRSGTAIHEEILGAARERNADLIVLSTQLRTVDGEPFLGHGTEYVLEHADQTLVILAFPGQYGATGGARGPRDDGTT